MGTGSERTLPATGVRQRLVDAGLYAASALFAGLTWAFADPFQRNWGRFAIWAYAAGALAAGLLPLDPPRRRRILAIAVMTGATVAPLVWGVSQRSGTDPGASARSEVFVVEDGATALVEGRDPYTVRFEMGPLASRPEPTRTHVPYPPAMLLFGLPAAIFGPGPATDARVWFLLVSIVGALVVLRMMRSDDEGRLRSFQVLFVLPTGALLLATGGHDIPVLVALLAAFVLADRGRTDEAGAAGGLALVLRQTSVLALPFVATLVPSERRVRFVAWASLSVLTLVVPFLLWEPRAFVEDVVLFPLGLGDGRSSARTPTLGSALIELVPGARTPITILLVVAIVTAVVLLVRMGPSPTAAGASARAAVAFSIAIALAPAARAGYVVYPISLAMWSYAFGRGARPEGSELAPTATARGTARD